MSSSSDRPDHDYRQKNDPLNPFVAFRRFADEQLSSITTSLFGGYTPTPPPAPVAPRPFQDYQAWLDIARESRQRLERETEEADRIMNIYARAHSDSSEVCNDNRENPSRDGDESSSCPFLSSHRDFENHVIPESAKHFFQLNDQIPSALSRAAVGRHLPHTSFFPPLFENNVSLVPFLLHNSYSPVHLEHQEHLRKKGIAWRDAFRDLLAAGQDEDHPSKQSKVVHDDDDRAAEWVHDLISLAFGKEEAGHEDSESQSHWTEDCRGPRALIPIVAAGVEGAKLNMDMVDDRDVDHHDQNDGEDDEELAELDLYDKESDPQKAASRKLSSHTPLARPFASACVQPDSLSNANPNQDKPSILSTLTTTERTILPDGSAQTKVVLKKRFSDGREESSETVHLQNARPPVQEHFSSQENKRQDTATTNKEAKTRGWFWS